ncbi:MAG TPA: MFS transporter [Chloroflexota bacterium]|nr:MFS transporter [Chloroflexota bacterium]
MRRWPDPRPFLAVVLINAGDGIANTLVPLYLDTSGFPVDLIGVLVAVAGVTSLLSRLPSGLAYRRRRARALMYAAVGLQAASTALYALPATPLLFGLVRALHGFAVGMATTVNMALFMDSLAPGGDRHRHLAAYASALSAGYTIGGVGGGSLGYWLGYGPAFLCAAAFPLLAALCVTAPARAAATVAPARPDGPPGATDAAPRLAPARGPGRWGDLRAALRHPQVATVSVVAFFLGVIHFMGQTFVPLYAQNVGINLAEIGLLRSTHSLANTLARPFCGELTRWLGHQRVFTLGMVLITGLMMLTPFHASLLWLMVLFTGIGLGRAGVLVANTVSMAEIQEGAVRRGVVVGLYNAARDLGNVVGPVVGGYIAAAVGLRAFFWVGPPLVLALYGLLLWLTTRLPAAVEAKAPTP